MNLAARALAVDSLMIVHSDLLGDLEIAPDEVIRFPAGLFGFPECREFVLVSAQREGLYWLQSLDHGTLAFLLVDPFPHFEGFAVDLAPTDCVELQLEQPVDAAVLAIVTLPHTRQELPTANLQGPLALNLGRKLGKQLALESSAFGVRSPFDLSASPPETA